MIDELISRRELKRKGRMYRLTDVQFRHEGKLSATSLSFGIFKAVYPRQLWKSNEREE